MRFFTISLITIYFLTQVWEGAAYTKQRVLATWTEYNNADHTVAWVLTVRTDGSATLIEQPTADEQIRWAQVAHLTTSELALVKALVDEIATEQLQSSYSPTISQPDCRDARLTTPVYTLALTCWDTTFFSLLPDSAQTLAQFLHQFSQPLYTLITYQRDGGFAAQPINLTIYQDGTATLLDERSHTTTAGVIETEVLATIRALIQSEAFATFDLPDHNVCSDCFVYTMRAMTSQGSKTYVVSGDFIEELPVELQQLITALEEVELIPDAGVSSPNGRIVFLSDGGIYTVTPDGAVLHEVINGAELKVQPSLPELSPDGQQIVFLGTDSASAKEVYTIRIDGTQLTRLTRVGDVNEVHWSPDGQYLAFNVLVAYEYMLIVMNSDGSHQQLIPTEKEAFTFGWVPGTQQLMTYSAIFDLEGNMTHEFNLVIDSFDCITMDISPINPTQFVCTGTGDIQVMDGLTGEITPIVSIFAGIDYESNPATWSPDGKYLLYGLFNRVDRRRTILYVTRADGTASTPLAINGLTTFTGSGVNWGNAPIE